MSRRTTFAAVLILFAGLLVSLAQPSYAADSGSRALYLVQMDGAPLAAYEGGVAGIPSTRPPEGARLDKDTWNYQAYRQYLRDRREHVLRSAGVDQRSTVAEYTTVFNGFGARLNAEEVGRLERTPGVMRVWKNEIFHTDTISTPRFLGLDGPSGAWNAEFGTPEHAGEGVVVGVIDTGFWPESPSLAALPGPRPDEALIKQKWYADGVDKCDEGASHPVACNNKVIGARYYDKTGLGTGFPAEFQSPRDYDGHGTHTAGTALGEHDIPATINGEAVGHVSGMAPAARLAVYKALWRQDDGEGSGGTIDLVQAIDDAVTDGVDIINYSVSGSSTYVVDPTSIAFFNAAAAGVFIATSAGNSGPDTSTVAHVTPWTTTVAASSHDRGAEKTVTLGNGMTLKGVGQGKAVPSAPLIDSVKAGLPAANATNVELCYPKTLDPVKVKGKIVLCKRGVNARTDKSMAVRDAGGVGMILYNPTLNSLNADYHVIPSVHIGHVEGAAVKAYLASAKAPTAALSAVVNVTPEAPEVAAFSSAGPAVGGGGDLIKPDISAPGVDIVAAVSPAGHYGNLFDGVSGTSMSAPHIAGIAALLVSKHPTWSPAAVRSALMTTATQTDNQKKPIQRAGVDATPFDMGAGQVKPSAAFDPGLVYDSGPTDWIRYGCGIGQFQQISTWCDSVGMIDPSDLNYPSIAIGDLPGRQTVTRTVKNVTAQSSVYVASGKAPTGFEVTVSPSTLTVPPGGTASYTVTFARTTAAYNTWAFGALTWTDLRGHAVRSPIAVKPVALSGPGEITGSGVSGKSAITLRAGYTGSVTSTVYGLTPSTVTTSHLVGSENAFKPDAPAEGPAAKKIPVTVPAGSKAVRFATFAADHVPNCDVDLFVYKSGKLVDSSLGGTADEEITLSDTGTFDVYVVQYSIPTGTTEQLVKEHTFIVPAKASGNLTVTPVSVPVAPDQNVPFAVAWSGLEAGKRYLGEIEFSDGIKPRAWTLVAIG
jgi:subtilisin family serine protease